MTELQKARAAIKDAIEVVEEATSKIKELREQIRRINISRGQMRKKLNAYEKRIDNIENLRAIKCTEDEYQRGQANGLILALATMKDESPEFIQKPRKKK